MAGLQHPVARSQDGDSSRRKQPMAGEHIVARSRHLLSNVNSHLCRRGHPCLIPVFRINIALSVSIPAKFRRSFRIPLIHVYRLQFTSSYHYSRSRCNTQLELIRVCLLIFINLGKSEINRRPQEDAKKKYQMAEKDLVTKFLVTLT